MLYAMRITLPDRPGTLGAVATALSALGADIVALAVVDRDAHHATDELCIEAQGVLPDELRETVQGVPGVTAEIVRRTDRVPDPLAALRLADAFARGIGPPLDVLVEGLLDALHASWAFAVDTQVDEVRVLAATTQAPVPARLETPWLPLAGPRRLDYADWFPPRWRMSRFEIAAAPLEGAGEAVIVGRPPGMRFHATELTQLEILAGMAVRADRGARAILGA